MTSLPPLADPERALALAYAPAAARPALAALWSLDTTLAGIVRVARQPLVGQMRLTWWHAALSRLGDSDLAGQPLLAALARDVLARGVDRAALAAMIDGWEVLLDDPPLSDAALSTHAEARGGALFDVAASVLGASTAGPIAVAGQGWALIDLGVHLTDADARARCFGLALPILAAIDGVRWDASARPLGMLARLATIDAHAGPDSARRQGSPSRLGRMLLHRMTGR